MLQPMTDRVAKKLEKFIQEDYKQKTSRKLWKTGLIASAASILFAIGALLVISNDRKCTIKPLQVLYGWRYRAETPDSQFDFP